MTHWSGLIGNQTRERAADAPTDLFFFFYEQQRSATKERRCPGFVVTAGVVVASLDLLFFLLSLSLSLSPSPPPPPRFSLSPSPSDALSSQQNKPKNYKKKNAPKRARCS